jgi:cytochrome P450
VPGLTPPSVPGSRLLGNIPELRRDALAFMENAARLGDVVRYRLANLAFYLVTHPEGVQRILQDNNRNYTRTGSVIWDALKPAFGNPLIVSDGESWFQRRRTMQPVFVRRHVAEFATAMVQRTRAVLDSWAPHAGSGTPIDLSPAIGDLTLGILLQAIFGVDNPATLRALGEATFIQNQDAILRSTVLVYPPLAVPTPHNLRLRAANRMLDRHIYALIASHRERSGDPSDLLGLLLEARDPETGEGLSDRQLRDEVASLYFAGYSTSSNTLLWALYLLAKHPAAMQRLVDEIDAELGDRVPTPDDLGRLTYPQMVLFETLRLYPPGWVSVRKVVADDQILGYAIPAGSHVTISAHVVHRDPRCWNDPLAFQPERFSPENAKDRPRYEYFPFLGGPHQCLGRDFVLLEAPLVLVLLAQRYRLRLPPGHVATAEPLVTQRMRGPLPMLIEPR